jgi:HlyD family secretion protein
LLTIAADSESKLVIHPDERNLATIQLGQRARASADAFPTEVFDAEIDYIAPSIDPERGSVEVRLRVIHPPAGLRPDMTVSVDLTVASVANALTLPSEAIHGAATAAPSVWVVRDDRVYVQPIKLGIRGDDRSQILSGIDEKSYVVSTDMRALSAGQRVRPVREEQ